MHYDDGDDDQIQYLQHQILQLLIQFLPFPFQNQLVVVACKQLEEVVEQLFEAVVDTEFEAVVDIELVAEVELGHFVKIVLLM